WIPVAQAARRLQVSERTIRRRAQNGKLERRRDGRRSLVKVAALPPVVPTATRRPEWGTTRRISRGRLSSMGRVFGSLLAQGVGSLVVLLFAIYALGVMVCSTYFDWEYARKNGFVRWLFSGNEADHRAYIWPYAIYLERRKAAEEAGKAAAGHASPPH